MDQDYFIFIFIHIFFSKALTTCNKSAFLKSHLPAFATANRSIEISISPRPSVHPIIRASYVNGREKVICVRNLAKEQILKKAELLRDASGDQLKRRAKLGIVSHVGRGLGRPGEGVGEKGGVRGIWSPFHLPPTSSSKPFKI